MTSRITWGGSTPTGSLELGGRPLGTSCAVASAHRVLLPALCVGSGEQGRDTIQKARQQYHCKGCRRHFDDLTGTVFAGHHPPLRVWIGCLYLMGLNLSNRQIAQALGLNGGDVQGMTEQLRQGVVAAQPEPVLSGEVECDEV